MVGLRLLALAALAGVASCGEGTDLGQTAYEADFDRFAVLTRDISARAPTDPSTLPRSGSVNYAGVMGFDTSLDGRSSSVLGDLDLIADFGNSEVVGTASGFNTSRNESVDGILTVDNGLIDRAAAATVADPTFQASVRGQLTSPRGTALQYRGTMDGDFYGLQYGYVGGSVDGNVDDGVVISPVDGSFAASQ